MVAQLSGSTIIRRDDLPVLVRARLDEANALRRSGLFAGAVYLAGYAVECQLKLAICKTLDWEALRGTFKTHDLELLMLHSGFDSKLRINPLVAESFANIRVIWNGGDSLRYSLPSSIDGETADLFMDCVNDREKGVIPWLQRMIS